MTGFVYLVGGGPGDAGLLTSRGRRLIEEADAIVYDRLVSPRLLSLARTDALTYYVGKESSHHTVSQKDIEALLVELALSGKTVVRLKGGDPFVFGRGGEEALALNEAGIPWEVVPGISSALAVPAYAGIPVTHRNVSPSFTVVTGHRTIAEELGQVEAAAIGDTGTLVILMGLAQIRDITPILVGKGRSAQTPVAVVRAGTRAKQETLIGDLGTIADQVEQKGFRSPAIIVVGEVVRLRQSLSWFEEKPLFGRRILTLSETRAHATQLADEYEALGAEVLDVSLEHLWSLCPGKIEELAQSVSQYGGILFSTRVSVRAFFSQLKRMRQDIRRSLRTVQFAALDSYVADELWAHGVEPDVVITPADSLVKAKARTNGPHTYQPMLMETLTSGNASEQIIHLTQGLKRKVQTPKMLQWIEEVTRTHQNVFVEQSLSIQLSPTVPAHAGGSVHLERLLEPCLKSPVLQALRDFTAEGFVDVVCDRAGIKAGQVALQNYPFEENREVVEFS